MLIAALWARRVIGAVLIGILAATAAGMTFGLQPVPALAAAPPSMAPTFLQMHFSGAPAGRLPSVVLVFLLLDLLDTSGTLTAVGHQAGLMENGRLKNARRALVSDAAGTMIGAALGTSPVTAYIESAAGRRRAHRPGGGDGGRAVRARWLFAPLAGAVPAYATAPALIFVAALFAKDLKDVAWDDVTEALPALVTALAIPLTFSIATGIGLGFIAYAGDQAC